MEDRQLIDTELARLTSAGWQVVSQTDHSAQVMYPHVVASALVAIFVFGPLLLGMFAALVSMSFAIALFWIAVISALLLALGHICARPKLLYITADQLRK